MLSCHRQHINSIRHGWHFSLLFPVLSFKLLQCMDQQIFWSTYADSTFSQFVHWVISCYYLIIFVYSMVGWVICHLILFRVLIKRASGFTVSEVCTYETMFFHGATVTMKFPRQRNVMQLKSFRAVSLFWLPETSPDNKLVYVPVTANLRGWFCLWPFF